MFHDTPFVLELLLVYNEAANHYILIARLKGVFLCQQNAKMF